MKRTILVMLALCATGLPAEAQQGAPSTVPVGTVSAELKPIARATDFVGRVEAIQRVEVRARVKGFLEEVLFKEGDLVKEGAPLYRIEKGLFEAEVRAGPGRAGAQQGGAHPGGGAIAAGGGIAGQERRHGGGARPGPGAGAAGARAPSRPTRPT